MTTEGKQEPGAGPTRSDSREGFSVIPAVDLFDDEAVRLEQGDFDRVAVRAGDPAMLVTRLAAARPPFLHIVDLEGARAGLIRPRLIADLVNAAGTVPVQASGGIRCLADAESLLGAGARRVVIGTAAFSDRSGLEHLANALGERLVVAIDARDGVVSVGGWEHSTGLTIEEAATRCAEAGVQRLLCTAIERDGTLEGPDIGLLARVQESSGLPVLAAGGIRSEDDLRALAALGLEGAIVGRALLEGRIPLSCVTASTG